MADFTTPVDDVEEEMKAEQSVCPITLEPFIEPVIASDGVMYERSALEQWLGRNQRSPITAEPMTMATILQREGKAGEEQDQRCTTWSGHSSFMHVHVPDEVVLKPLSLVIVLHLSWTELDERILRHALAVICAKLHEQDSRTRVALVGGGEVCVPFCGAEQFAARFKSVSWPSAAGGNNTLVERAVDVGFKTIERHFHHNYKHALLLLTGHSLTPSPIRKHHQSWQFARRFPNSVFVECVVAGFGVHLDSTYLLALARWMEGQFLYVPDTSMLASTLIDAIGAFARTVHARAYLMPAGTDDFGDPQQARKKRRALGPIRKGQNRTVFWGDPLHPRARVVVRARGGGFRPLLPGSNEPSEEERKAALQRHFMSRPLVAVVGRERYRKERFVEAVHSLAENLEGALLEDVLLTVLSAVQTREVFRRWGKAYVASFTNSHMIQTCTNFKDTSLQEYGGWLARHWSEEVGMMFKIREEERDGDAVHMSAYLTPTGVAVEVYGVD